MRLSVIVPCYNVEKYLVSCVQSIIDASVSSMEIILIDDGSTDNTLSLCKSLAKDYNQISVIHQSNKGLSGARNAGIKKAQGEYIAFIDSDDTVDKEMFTTMLDLVDKYPYDVVVCGERRIFPNKEMLVSSGIKDSLHNKEEIKRNMCNLYPAACNKIYKREIFEKCMFKEGVWFEDVDFLYRYVPFISSVGYVDGYYYNYYQRESSITYTYNEKLYDFVYIWNELLDFYRENGLFDDYHIELEYCYIRYLYATFIQRLAKMRNWNEFKKGVRMVRKNVFLNFPYCKGNPYMKGLKGFYLRYFNFLFATFVYWKESIL